MRTLYFVYCLCGLISLGYQVAWFRIFADRLGSSNLTFTLVVCNFVGGLGLGALASARVQRALGRAFRTTHPLRAYGGLELLITAAVLLTPAFQAFPARLWGTFPYVDVDGVFEPTLTYQLAKIALATAVLFPPCFLMGVSFPLLCAAYPGHRHFPATLYGWNTLGACLGVLLCEFIVVPYLGHDACLRLMAGANAALAIFVLWAGPRWEAGRPLPAGDVAGEPASAARYSLSVGLTCAALGGFLTGALEGDLFKRLWFLGANVGPTMSFISFWAIVAIFLASWTVRWVRSMDLGMIKFLFGWALVLFLVVWDYAFPIADWTNRSHRAAALEVARAQSGSDVALVMEFQSGLLPLLVFVGAFVLPPMYCLSCLFPHVCNALHRQGRHLGWTYGLNTLAFCAGLIVFTTIAPRVNTFYSLKLFPGVLALGILFLISLRTDRPLGAWRVGAVLAGAALLGVFTPAGFDKSFFRSESPAARFPVRALKSNGAHTSYVVEHPTGRSLYFDNYSMSATTSPAQRYMRLMAHYPLLLQPAPRRALLIGFGVGNTADAISSHGEIEEIIAVDLNEKVFETAPEFAETNGEVYRDRRLRMVHDDGRTFLALTDLRFDLVTSEPPPPMEEGTYRLYSKEYYEAVHRHLTPEGMMTQWLPVQQMPRRAVELAVRTFLRVFPDVLLFVGHDTEFILLGGQKEVSLANIARAFGGSPRLKGSLAGIGVDRPASLLARIVKMDAELREEFGEGRVLSDQHNDFSHLFHDPREPVTISFHPQRVLQALRERDPQAYATVRPLFLHLGKLRATVPDFPISTLLTVRTAGASEVRYADVDWRTVDALRAQAARAQAGGDLGTAIATLEKILEHLPEEAGSLLHLAQLRLLAGHHDETIEQGRRYQALMPEDARGYAEVGQALALERRYAEAIVELRTALELDPANPEIARALDDALSNASP